jgi:predicted nucleic acid-binding protein
VTRLSIYLDTSIISFLYADDEPELRDITREFFESFLEKYDVAVSEVLLFEIGKATNETLRRGLYAAVEQYGLAVVRLDADEEQEAFALADRYVEAGIIPPAKREDALHLAIATVRQYDILLSWNFRHLANIRKQAQVNTMNAQAGYLRPLSLLNPMEVMYEE